MREGDDRSYRIFVAVFCFFLAAAGGWSPATI